MTFEAHETSDELGAPIELYVFRIYGVNYYYTNAATDKLVDAVTYDAVPIERSEITDNNDLEKQNVELTVAQDFPILLLYDEAPPSDVITLQIKCMHRDDDEVVTIWSGRVTTGARHGSTGKLYCENVYSSMRRSGLRRLYGRLCPHQLYGNACGLADTSFRIQVPVDAVGGLEIESAILATYADDRFAGGMVQFEPTPGKVLRRGIKSHVGSILTVTHGIPELEALDNIYVYLGCKHTLADCDTTFGNAVNYGGWPFIPRLSPMGQSSVF